MKLTHLFLMISSLLSCGDKGDASQSGNGKQENTAQPGGNCTSPDQNQNPPEFGGGQKPTEDEGTPPNPLEGWKDIRVDFGYKKDPLLALYKNDTIILKSVPKELTSVFTVRSVYGLLGSKLDTTFCKNVKTHIDWAMSGLDEPQPRSKKYVRDRNNIQFHSVVLPFTDTGKFRTLLESKIGLEGNHPVRILNPYTIQSVEVGITLADDAMTRILGEEAEFLEKFSKKGISLAQISGEATFGISQADLACDLMNGKAIVELRVQGTYREYGTQNTISNTTKVVLRPF